MTKKRKQHELVGFLAIWAVEYAKSSGLDGLHPRHYDLMVKYGARMDSFKRAIVPGEASAVSGDRSHSEASSVVR